MLARLYKRTFLQLSALLNWNYGNEEIFEICELHTQCWLRSVTDQR